MNRAVSFNSHRRFNIARALLLAIFVAQFQFMPAQAAAKYTGCANKKTGVIRLLTKGKCNSKTEKTITWNSTGIPGAAGPAGAPGAQGAAGANGKDGIDGKNGLDGKSGVDGKSGNTVLYGTTNPTSSTGVTGDFYINTATSMIFGPKTTVWPAGTSLVGPQGPGGVGPVGAQGPAGVTGASTQVLWLNPRDLLSTPPTKEGYTDTSSVVLLNFSNDGLWQPYYFEALELGYAKPRGMTFAIPKGWSGYKSLQFKVFWMTEETTTSNIKFEILMNFVREGNDFSLANRPKIYVMGGDSDITSKPSPGPNIVNVITLNTSADSMWVNPPRDGDLMFMTLRRPFISGLYTGKVFVLGISIQANF